MKEEHRFPNLKISRHPLIKDKVTRLRDQSTPFYEFRRILEEVSILLFYEASSHLPLTETTINTPLETTQVHCLKEGIVLAPILRAGMGMVNGILKILPEAAIGLLGMYRDENTLQPVDYYLRLPPHIRETDVFLLDPMLATGGSAAAAINILKERRVKSICMISIISAPEGVHALENAHPDIPVYTAALDRQLNSKGFILPGLGDAGDRYFGT